MSLTTLKETLERIDVAEADSPLAVFTTGGEKVDSIPARTVLGQRRIQQDANLVGLFHNRQCRKRAAAILRAAINASTRGMQR